jgi:hypothetical protein
LHFTQQAKYLLKLPRNLANKFALYLLFLFLFACQSIRIEDYQKFTSEEFSKTYSNFKPKDITGKFTYYIKEKGYSGSLRISQKNNVTNLIILTPLNSILAKVKIFSDGGVEINSINNEEFNKTDLIELMRQKDLLDDLIKISFTDFTNISKSIQIINRDYSICIDKFKLEQNQFLPEEIKIKFKQHEMNLLYFYS